MHKSMKRLEINVEHIVMTIINERGNDLLYSLSISSNVFMKLTMGTFIMGGRLLRTKLDFVFARVVSLKSDIN